MKPEGGQTRWDVVVAGAGPAGSIAALVLARSGARVALVDKAAFPRDKACGDLIGPRGVRLLEELGVRVPDAGTGSDLLVAGPSRQRSRLPAFGGKTYADHGMVVPRRIFDDALRAQALAAGATPVRARVTAADRAPGGPVRALITSDGGRLASDIVIGADGALSQVAQLAGMLDSSAALWGFAIRGYIPAEVPLPLLVLMDERPWRIYPGYGWLFPGADGQANVGIGIGMGRRRAPAPLRPDLDRLCALLRRDGDISPNAHLGPIVGGWLRMGGTGTPAAAGNVLLIGDAAGLINPLQGEGIGPAMVSARAAAEAVIKDPDRAGGGLHRGDRRAHEPVHDRRRGTAGGDARAPQAGLRGHAPAHLAAAARAGGRDVVAVLERAGRWRGAASLGPRRRARPGPRVAAGKPRPVRLASGGPAYLAAGAAGRPSWSRRVSRRRAALP